MQGLEEISESVHRVFEVRTSKRDKALAQARTLTRHCANAIRAIHRSEAEAAQAHIDEARLLAEALKNDLNGFPDLYYAGYTQDALKEYAEACIVYGLVYNQPLPDPQALELVPSTYMQGLAEAASEMRRRCLDALMKGNPAEAERLLGSMDDIYAVLVTMDYPDAITGGLRRLTDILRSVTERTRSDLTLSLRQEHLERSMKELERRLENFKG